MKSLPYISKPMLVYTLLAFILAAYAAVRVLNLSQAVQRVKTTADTTSYVRMSQGSIFGDQFWAGSRPWMFPLLLKLLNNNAKAVVWVQGILSIVSWSILAVAAAHALHIPILRFSTFGLVLLFSLYRYIIGWDSVLLTESLSLSLMALFLASWLWLIRTWHWGKAALVLIVAFLWTFVRDTNAWVVLMLALFLFALVALRIIDRKYLAFSLAFLGMFFASNLSADLGDRWVFPFQNVLGRRILPDAQALDFFARCGMPVSPELVQLSGAFANSSERAFYEDPALEGYRSWVDQAGKRCYVKWLLSDPMESMRGPLAEFNALISMQDLQPFLFSRRFSPILPGLLESILFPRLGLLIVLALTWATVLVAILVRAWQQNKTWWLVIGMNILVLPHYFIIWHGDVMGIYRHVMSVSIQFYLGAWLLVLLVLDSVFSLGLSRAGFANPFSLSNVEQKRNAG